MATIKRIPQIPPMLLGWMIRPDGSMAPVWHVPAPGDKPAHVTSYRRDLARMIQQFGGKLADAVEVQR